MSRQSEDILLQVANVKHKKNPGTIYLMGERLAWMASHKSDTFAVNHKYVDIKSQKISPEGKPKIQLQIVLHDGSCTTFHFNDPVGGRDAQIKQRDDVKELLQQLLPKFKKKVNKELEEKNRMLSENPGLLQLYKDLVITNIISPEEFWTEHATKPSTSSAVSSSANTSSALSSRQEVGVTPSFLADIKPQVDGANGVRFNLTTDIIDSIFKTYPAVKRKHLENVPAKISEQEFWTKFFQSHYFHRDRLHGKGVKDIFTECAKDDDKKMKEDMKLGVADPMANLAALCDKTLDENFGGGDNSGDKDSLSSSSSVVHRSIIKRFNQHSIMVMRAGQKDESSEKAAEEAVPCKRRRLQEKTAYEDLSTAPASKPAALRLTKCDRYLIGPTPPAGAPPSDFGRSEVSQWRNGLAQTVGLWRRQNCRDVLSARNAVSVLNDLSPGGALMKSSQQEALAGQYPGSIRQDLRALYVSLAELLRHFWACFVPTPPSTAAVQEKAAKMHETLRKFHAVKLRPFENEMMRTYTSGPRITLHLNQMLDAAYRKFATWQQNASRQR